MKGKKLRLSAVMIAVFVCGFSARAAEKSFPERASAAEFFAWQTEARSLLSDILYNGPAPARSALDPVYGKHETRESCTLSEVTFNDRPGHVTHGWLARPRAPAAARLPAIVALHGHGWGAHDAFNPENMYYYGDFFARRGYIVLALDIGHDFVDHDQPFVGVGVLPRNVDFPAMGQRVWMVTRGIDLLEDLPDVDGDAIGVMGLSNGGLSTMFIAGMDTRVKLAVASGSLIMHGRMWHAELFHCRCQYLDRMDGVLDYYDVLALAAPRALIIQNGRRDSIFPVRSSDKAFAHVKMAYEIAGAPDMAYHDVHDGTHEFSSEVPVQWAEKYLPLTVPGDQR